MTVYASFDDASILQLLGWGKIVDPTDRHYRVELADVGELAVYEPGLLRDKKMLSVSIEHLQFIIWTRQTTTGQQFVGGGFGIGGALMGMAQARILNALTLKTHEDTLLGVAVTLPNGTQRELIFGLRDLNESDLRDTLAPAVHDWADGYIKAQLSTISAPATGEPDLTAAYTTIDRMRQRAILDDTQALILSSHASRPFIAAVMHKLRDHTASPGEARRLRHKIDELHRTRRITDHQAQEVRDLLASEVAPPASAPPGAAQSQQIELLAQLRHTGAISEAEFQAEKRRLLTARPQQ